MTNIMKTFLALVLAFSLIPVSQTLAQAGSCAAKARSVAANNGGRVLSVSSFQRGGTTMCQITVLIKSRNGGPARKRTVVVRK